MTARAFGGRGGANKGLVGLKPPLYKELDVGERRFSDVELPCSHIVPPVGSHGCG